MNEELALIPVDEQAAPDAPTALVSVTEAVDVPAFYQNASGLSVTPDEQTRLLADFDESEIEIRPDGLIYLPQSFFRSRLNQVFGVGQWALVQHRTHRDDNYLYFDGSLYVRGCFVARAMGEGQMHNENKMQSWAGVYESAKSDCIVRCCKDLSIAAKLWQPAFARQWTDTHAVKVWQEYEKPDKFGKKGKFVWRRKDAPPFWWEKKGAQSGGGNSNGKPAANGSATAKNVAPAKDRPAPKDEPKPAAPAPADPGAYVIPAGKRRGLTLSELEWAAIKEIREGCRMQIEAGSVAAQIHEMHTAILAYQETPECGKKEAAAIFS